MTEKRLYLFRLPNKMIAVDISESGERLALKRLATDVIFTDDIMKWKRAFVYFIELGQCREYDGPVEYADVLFDLTLNMDEQAVVEFEEQLGFINPISYSLFEFLRCKGALK